MYSAKNDNVILNTLPSDHYILDVGCGTGTNARELKNIVVNCNITGINHSKEELEAAGKWLDESIVFDLNSAAPLEFDRRFDLIVCSHILEHLVTPSDRVEQLSKFLTPTGRMILIVPNFAVWKARLKLLSGRFEYSDHGLYDSTHLRFYTWHSFPKEVVPANFEVVQRMHSGCFPMPFLRRMLPHSVTRRIDNFFLDCFPNLFSSEVGLIIKKRKSGA